MNYLREFNERGALIFRDAILFIYVRDDYYRLPRRVPHYFATLIDYARSRVFLYSEGDKSGARCQQRRRYGHVIASTLDFFFRLAASKRRVTGAMRHHVIALRRWPCPRSLGGLK